MEVRAIERDIINKTTAQQQSDDILQYQDLNAMCGRVSSQSHSMADDSVGMVNTLIDNVGCLEMNHAVSSLAAHREKGMILMTYLTFANWMQEIRSGIDNIYDCNLIDVPANQRWISRLSSDVRTAIIARVPSKTFKASSYVTCDAIADRESTMNRSTRPLFLTDDKIIKNATMDWVLDIIEGWVGIESRTKQPRWKLVLLRLIYNAFGIQALALEGTWKIFATVTPLKVCRKAHKKSLVAEDMIQFRQALAYHPLANSNSSEAFNAYVIFKYKNRGWATGIYSKGSMNSPLCPRRVARIIDANEPMEELRMVRREYFRIYVEGAISAVNEHTDTTCGTKDQVQIIEDPEQFCPFRECLPSWSTLTRLNGPYNPAVITTAPGLFSAVILAMFGFKQSQHEKHLFDDYNDWKEYHKRRPPPNSWNREKDALASHWWRTIVTSTWTDVAGPTLPFMHAYQFLVENLRDIGAVTGMNIASNLASTGACCTPTAAEMANVLYMTRGKNKTALAIKYLSGTNSTDVLEDKSVIAQILEVARSDMIDVLEEQSQCLIGCITVPTVQYCLSKFATSSLLCYD